ncbi:helix-turn-helix domain-containing protein [Clostridium chromiireducens]
MIIATYLRKYTYDRANLDHLDKICKVLECDLNEIMKSSPDKVVNTW